MDKISAAREEFYLEGKNRINNMILSEKKRHSRPPKRFATEYQQAVNRNEKETIRKKSKPQIAEVQTTQNQRGTEADPETEKLHSFTKTPEKGNSHGEAEKGQEQKRAVNETTFGESERSPDMALERSPLRTELNSWITCKSRLKEVTDAVITQSREFQDHKITMDNLQTELQNIKSMIMEILPALNTAIGSPKLITPTQDLQILTTEIYQLKETQERLQQQNQRLHNTIEETTLRWQERLKELEEEKNTEIEHLKNVIQHQKNHISGINQSLLFKEQRSENEECVQEKNKRKMGQPKSTIIISGKSPETNISSIFKELQSITPDPQIKITKLQRKGNKIEIRTNSEDTKESLKNHLQADKLLQENSIIRDKQPQLTKIIFFNVPLKAKEEVFLESMGFLEDPDSIPYTRVCAINLNRSNKTDNWVVLTTRKLAQKFLNGPSRFMGFRRIICKKYIRASRCHRCQSFYHKAQQCKNELFCAYCSEDHESVDCPRTKCECINCKDANKNENLNCDIQHPAYDIACPFYQEYRNSIFAQYEEQTKPQPLR